MPGVAKLRTCCLPWLWYPFLKLPLRNRTLITGSNPPGGWSYKPSPTYGRRVPRKKLSALPRREALIALARSLRDAFFERAATESGFPALFPNRLATDTVHGHSPNQNKPVAPLHLSVFIHPIYSARKGLATYLVLHPSSVKSTTKFALSLWR